MSFLSFGMLLRRGCGFKFYDVVITISSSSGTPRGYRYAGLSLSFASKSDQSAFQTSISEKVLDVRLRI
jgi:hypothetical protein